MDLFEALGTVFEECSGMIEAAMFRLAATRAVMMQMRPFTSVMPQGITRSCDRQPCPRGARQLGLPRVKCRPYVSPNRCDDSTG